MRVSELQEKYPDFSIICRVFDDEHNGDYLYDDNVDLGNRECKFESMDDSFAKIIRCRCV